MNFKLNQWYYRTEDSAHFESYFFPTSMKDGFITWGHFICRVDDWNVDFNCSIREPIHGLILINEKQHQFIKKIKAKYL